MGGIPHLIAAPGENHGRQRRVISHAFSDKALREQEGLLQSYVDLLISRFRDISDHCPDYASGGDGWDSTGKIELCKWYNGFTFDVITDLSFGHPFGSLADMKQHLWVGYILESLKAVKFAYVTYYFPIVRNMGSLIINKSQIKKRFELFQFVRAKTAERVASETQRPDFITSILENSEGEGKKGEGLRKGELESNLGIFLVAGTETTATTLSIGSYLLLEHPTVMNKLEQEIRSRYKSNVEITVDSLVHLEYLNAFIHETLRCYPPVPAGFLRKVPKTGADVAGVHFSGKGNVSPLSSSFAVVISCLHELRLRFLSVNTLPTAPLSTSPSQRFLLQSVGFLVRHRNSLTTISRLYNLSLSGLGTVWERTSHTQSFAWCLQRCCSTSTLNSIPEALGGRKNLSTTLYGTDPICG